ncbi:mRNA decay factor CTH1 [Nakaseomyces glabratus]|uniref:mRNA decay factor CTH1 n=1 Tax=Candida glabrata TaxID=5478 RepID=A0A0W0CCA8_CANGB|nr:mRNA decay factor CTH1 [Nakaseomyces glabratus]KTA97296.1 mRNA decay factor CTH1 [Nakaseomyces glabratus]KTA97595.1 mRNA decay factor CTH1 [Nakaseomyces glabratus]KTA98806.1 mRNA decay factor CTH1 [Nakaseomyces glabratus]KTB02042.1 mRNA decay factor CTH1 [Nakaseomyces glabratus]
MSDIYTEFSESVFSERHGQHQYLKMAHANMYGNGGASEVQNVEIQPEADDYEARIKEIEEYYLKTLLNEEPSKRNSGYVGASGIKSVPSLELDDQANPSSSSSDVSIQDISTSPGMMYSKFNTHLVGNSPAVYGAAANNALFNNLNSLNESQYIYGKSINNESLYFRQQQQLQQQQQQQQQLLQQQQLQQQLQLQQQQPTFLDSNVQTNYANQEFVNSQANVTPLNYTNIFNNEISAKPAKTHKINPFLQDKQVSRKSNLEVDIKHHYQANALPLTSENLQKMQDLSIDDMPIESINRKKFHIQKTTVDPTKQINSEPKVKEHQQQQQQQINKGLYKTELCETFTTKGFCKYGNKCQFAHGLQELKLKKTSNNFRTKPCINWDKLGYCPYGKRCCFKHGDDRDIQIYKKAGTYTANPDGSDASERKLTEVQIKQKNLHANIKKLQKMTW